MKDAQNTLLTRSGTSRNTISIYEADGTPCDVTPYKSSLTRRVIVYITYLLTFGLLRLLFHWFPRWMMQCMHRKCALRDAHQLIIKDSSNVYHPVTIMMTVFDKNSGYSFIDLPISSAQNTLHLLPEANLDPQVIKHFAYKRMKYIWNADGEFFYLLNEWDNNMQCEVFPVRPLSESLVSYRRMLFESNDIDIRLTPVSKLLLSECLNPFYCFQAFSCALWFAEKYYMYASCIMLMSIISLVTQVYELRRNERALKETVCSSSMITVHRNIGSAIEVKQIDSTELVLGDLIEIPVNGCTMHCDALLLTGNCIVNESSLTGESVPVTKTPFPEAQRKNHNLNIRTAGRHVLYGGTSVIQTRNYANERVLAVVARTGFRTAKGELVRSILYPKPMQFKFTQDSFKFIGALAILAVIGLIASIVLLIRLNEDVHVIIFHSLDLVTIVVPPALPMAMTVGVVFAQRRLRNHNIYCINPSAINVCGVVNVACFDKTGTLTEDGLDLWGVIPNEKGHFANPTSRPDQLDSGPLLEAMASCHSLTRIDGVLSGDPLDLKMFQSTRWEFIEEVSEDFCKFEMAVPAIVRPNSHGSMSNITLEFNLESDNLPYEVGILRQFPFTSSLQRMSVIARVLNSTHFSVYTKGAPEMIESLCRCDTIPLDFHSTLLEYTREGYRVLALAWRPLKVTYPKMLRLQRERVEHELLFLGFLIMENRLKPETTPVIQTLRNANIRPVMVTGDNMLTAVSVARDCEMIDEMDRIIIVSAKPPSHNTSNGQVGGGDVAGGSVPMPSAAVAGSSTSNTQFTIIPNALQSDLDNQTLVEFHYAEDLHKPVTEITATTSRNTRDYNRITIPPSKTRCTNIFTHPKWFKWKRGFMPKRCVHGTSLPGEPTNSLTVPISTTENGFDSHANTSNPVNDPDTTTHRVNIRMIDRPDIHLAISGKTWAVIKEHYPRLIPKLVVKGTVFSRFSPDQKTQLIEALQSVGYFVAMCGDGANDCGALKAAHAGISLSDTEASVASPFTSKQQNIGCVPTLIREGRCALVTSFGTFKFMASYSLVQFFTCILLYSIGSVITDSQFLFIDLFLISTLSVTFGYTRAYPHLSVEPPNMRLLSMITVMSLGFQLLVNFIFQFLAFVWVKAQPWYVPVFDVGQENGTFNYEGTVLFMISACQYTSLAVVFSKGPPYRRSIFSNSLFVFNVCICLACTVYMTTFPHANLLRWFEMLHIPSPIFVLLIQAAVVTNFIICYLLELVVDGVTFRRRLRHIRRALFPRHVHRKDYERIREEIDKLAGSWPPIIRSASVQALPKDLFHDSHATVAATTEHRVRHRTTSRLSTDTEDEHGVTPVSPRSTCFDACVHDEADDGSSSVERSFIPTDRAFEDGSATHPVKRVRSTSVHIYRRHSVTNIQSDRVVEQFFDENDINNCVNVYNGPWRKRSKSTSQTGNVPMMIDFEIV